MGNTDKDNKKALIKRGKAEYQRNNKRAKYERPGKHNTQPLPVEGMPPMDEGFFAKLRRKTFGF